MIHLRHRMVPLLFLVVAGFLHAHPHMWIDSSLIPVPGPGGLEAIDVTWTFDDFNSSSLMGSYDADRNGILDVTEIERARIDSFSHLIEKEYYLIVDVGGLLGTPLEAVDFTAVFRDGRLTYSFRSPLEIPIRWNDVSKVGLFLFDPTYFIDFRGGNISEYTLEWENRSFSFIPSARELGTQGYGQVIVAGLVSRSLPDSPSAGSEARRSFSSLIKDWSFNLQGRLASYSRRVVNERNPLAFFSAIGLAVIFGFIHVLGPGHGKMFTLAYFSSRKATLKEGLLLSGLINVLDSISAFILVGLTYGILSLTIQNTGAVVGRISRIVAYSAIIILGAGSLIFHIRSRFHESRSERKTGLKPWMLALTVGLIPCPVSSALLAYGIAEGALVFSLILVAGVSIGGMMALSFYSIAIIGGKSGFTRILRRGGMEKGLFWFETASLFFLAAAGAVLLSGVM